MNYEGLCFKVSEITELWHIYTAASFSESVPLGLLMLLITDATIWRTSQNCVTLNSAKMGLGSQSPD